MLKNLILSFAMLVGSSAFAASNHEICLNSLQYHFLANFDQADSICLQNSSPKFLKCMENKAIHTNLHVTDAAPECSKQVKSTSVFDTCESKLQVNTEMPDDRSVQICAWDSSLLMQSCIIDLVQKAHFHYEHAIQYCGFAGRNYRREIPRFKMCVIGKSKKGYDVYSSVQACHEDITYGGPISGRPNYGDQNQGEVVVTPDYRDHRNKDPRDNQNPKKNGDVVVSPEVQNEPADKNKTGAAPSKVPAPVEIKVQESSKPKVEDQPLDSESTSNAESLPID